MSAPVSPMEVFEASLGSSLTLTDNSNHNRAGQIDALIRETLHNASLAVADESGEGVLNQVPEADIWDNVGAFMLRASAIMAEFADRIQDADLVKQTVKGRIREARANSHLADLSVLPALDGKKQLFRQTCEVSAQYHKSLQAVWGKDIAGRHFTGQPRSSISSHHGTLPDSGDNATGRGRSRRTLPAGSQRDQRLPNDQGSGSEASDDSDNDLFNAVDLDALANRGKGVYHCPAGEACNKGGVDKDGKLVAFERNSSFVQHCNKHRKPFRCEEENCPNPPKKRKFARRDGLERHRNTVSHVPPSPGHQRPPKHALLKTEST